MNFALLVSEGDSDGPDLVEMEGGVVLVEVRGHPAHPHTGWLLAWKDPHRVVVLNHGGGKISTVTVSIYKIIQLIYFSGPASEMKQW